MWDTSPSAPQYLQYTAICQYGMEHCTVPHHTSLPWYTVHTYPQQVTRVHTIGHTNRYWCYAYEYTSDTAVQCSAIQYTTSPLHTSTMNSYLGLQDTHTY